MTILQEKFDKSSIQDLPRTVFQGRIITILNERESNSAVDYLLSFPLVGIDTETRPVFKKGITHQVALLQVATEDTAFLFRLNRIGITDSIKYLLESKQTAKVGLSLHDDFHQINARRSVTPQRVIELQNEVTSLGVQDKSLQKIYANLFGEKISKSQQLSNWEADVLSEAQQIYAATDAWACIKIHDKIKQLVSTGNYKLIPHLEPAFESNATVQLPNE